jgi:hypothetical protein
MAVSLIQPVVIDLRRDSIKRTCDYHRESQSFTRFLSALNVNPKMRVGGL